MEFDSKTQVICFDRRESHPGYILIRTIDKGLQSQTTLVRSLLDGQVYIRKHLHEKQNTGAELLVRNLPEDVAPKLIDYTSTLDPDQYEDIFIYQYCNGGKQFLPGALLWDIARQYVESVAYIHSGWREGSGAQDGWELIIHGDIGESNTFLHWDASGTAYSQILLGDWGNAHKIKEPKGRDMVKWREYQLADLNCPLGTLKELNIETRIRTPDAPDPTP